MVVEQEGSEVRERVVEVNPKTRVRLRALEVKAEAAKYRAAVAKSRAEAKDVARAQRFAAKIELAKIRARQSASEKARTNIALTSPALLMCLIGGFILALATGSMPEETIATSAALLTMLSAGLLQNLRSIISESNGNGHDEDETKPPPKPKPKLKD
jgi:thiol:disulfide interchange protein